MKPSTSASQTSEMRVEALHSTSSPLVPSNLQETVSGIGFCSDTSSATHGNHLRTSHEEFSQPSADSERPSSWVNAEEDKHDQSRDSEIQSIMDQFEDGGKGPKEEDIMSPRLELAAPMLSNPNQFPLRRSSLDPQRRPSEQSIAQKEITSSAVTSYVNNLSQIQSTTNSVSQDQPIAEQGTRTLSQPHQHVEKRPSLVSSNSDPSLSSGPIPQPEPEPEPDLPFDFHRFLEQLRHRSADPVARFLRSFLTEFGKKQWMVHEQVKIISDFLSFITNRMAQCEIWQGASDAEFDNAKEGMEKLVMNRLYAQTFSPAIPAPPPIQAGKGKRKDMDRVLGAARQGQHQEDIERDEILAEKVRIYGWVEEEHLDIHPFAKSGKRFLVLAQQELLKIQNYRAPRDKVICVLNCCKVIFGLLRNAKSSDTSADSFIPLLIYVILKANPEHLVSNIQYIFRFRNQDKLGGEAGYYLSSLMGAIQFIENLDRTSLTISDEAFEHNVELAVSMITERNKDQTPQRNGPTHVSEKSGLSIPEVTPRNSFGAERSLPRRIDSGHFSTERPPSNESDAESNPVAGILRNIQKPLSNIGRIFSDQPSTNQRNRDNTSMEPPDPPPRRLSPAIFHPPRHSEEVEGPTPDLRRPETSREQQTRYSAEDAAARQASTEMAEAQRIQAAEQSNVIE